MLFSELVDAVGVETARPDLVSDIMQAIQAVTTSIHTTDFWKPDLAEGIIAVVTDPSSFIFPIDIASKLPQHRKLKYLRKWDAVRLIAGDYFKGIDPTALMDAYNVKKINTFYLAGQTYQCYTNTADTAVYAGWYKFPVVAPVVSYASWVADHWPYAIIAAASAKVCMGIGKMEEAKGFMLQYNNPDSFNPGWIQKIYAANLVEGSES
jgi:hypothetical protein